MNWTKLLYVLIIVLLYVPMVFLGANVFFSEYTGQYAYYRGDTDCYLKYPYPAQPETLTEPQHAAIAENQRKCTLEDQKKQEEYDKAKQAYEGRKYTFIALFNLAVLLIALLVPLLKDSVVMGLFLGSTISTFASTIRFFDSKSRTGFIVLVITFLVMLYFINKKKDSFMDWKGKR